MAQVAGNVDKGKTFTYEDHTSGVKRSYIIETKLNAQWAFYKGNNVASQNIICYPLDEELVLSVHISKLKDDQVTATYETNEILISMIINLVGGDSE